MNRYLRLAVMLELLADVGLLAWVLASAKTFLIPTAVCRLGLMSFLGIRAVHGRRWARWCFSAILAGTVLAGVIVSLYIPGRGSREEIAWPIIAMSAVYAVLLWLTLFSGATRETPARSVGS